MMRRHDKALEQTARTLRVQPDGVPDAVAELRERVRELERASRSGAGQSGVDVDRLAADALEHDGARVLVSSVPVQDGKQLLELADRLKGKLGDAVIVLAGAGEDRVDLVAMVAPSLVDRGVRANEIVTAAAAAVGGGGGGRETLARAGGRDIERVPEAIAAARSVIEAALTSNH
jgi:alanyl-tRNA synthetase